MQQISTADAVWIATALLHKEYPERQWFTSKEIENKVIKEGLLRASLQTLRTHISQHCVANSPANPDTHRKLYAVGRGMRRLYASSDETHPSRINGRIEPFEEEIPSQYHHLIKWFREDYMKSVQQEQMDKKRQKKSRFDEILDRLEKLSHEERKERAKRAIKAVIAFERRRQN